MKEQNLREVECEIDLHTFFHMRFRVETPEDIDPTKLRENIGVGAGLLDEINTAGDDNSGRWDYSTAVWGHDFSVVGTEENTYPEEPEDGIELGEEKPVAPFPDED